MNNLTKSNEKPVLNPEGFQCLLAAAFILQGQNDPCPANPISGGHTRTFAIQRIVQKRTPSLREPCLCTGDMSKPLIQFANPRMWRTLETLAVATVFCMMIGVSLRRVSPLRANPSRPVMAGIRTARSSTPLERQRFWDCPRNVLEH